MLTLEEFVRMLEHPAGLPEAAEEAMFEEMEAIERGDYVQENECEEVQDD